MSVYPFLSSIGFFQVVLYDKRKFGPGCDDLFFAYLKETTLRNKNAPHEIWSLDYYTVKR